MDEHCFTFEFEEISDRPSKGKLRIIDHRKARKFNLAASINDRVLLDNRGLQVMPHVADLIDLAVSIYVADRWTRRKRGLPRVIRVSLPLRTDSFFYSTKVHDHLRQMLHWYTGDLWTFDFPRLLNRRRTAELQSTMFEPSNEGIETEVALWSGGLDALAGLCNRIYKRSAERFRVVGTGANPRVWGLKKRVFDKLKDRVGVDMELTRLHIEQTQTKQRGLHGDNLTRARGAVFMLLGSAYALLEQENALAVYENGPGALNLPFRASEVGTDHSRGVHPLSLVNASKLVSMVIGRPFVIHNPFIGSTKAEMCQVVDQMDLHDIAGMTQSCDRSLRNKIPQCGTCSSCLLRRQALLASGTSDLSMYLLCHGRNEDRETYLRKSHLPYMMHQTNMLSEILQHDNAWEVLAHKYPTLLRDIPYRLSKNDGQDTNDIAEEIVNVLRRYADEWRSPSVNEAFEAEIQDINRS